VSDLETSSLQIKDVNAYILGFKRQMVEKPIQIRQSNGIRASYNTHPPRDGMAQVMMLNPSRIQERTKKPDFESESRCNK
jgi:hypothetical protein